MNPGAPRPALSSRGVGVGRYASALVAFALSGSAAAIPSEARATLQDQWVLDLDLRIGTRIDPNHPLELVSHVLVGPAGELYVADARAADVKVFDRDGALVRTIGRRGSGPGEFARPTQLGWLGDTLWVTDPGQRQIVIFSSNGRFIRTLSRVFVPRESHLRQTPVQALLRDGQGLALPLPLVGDDGTLASTVSPLTRVRFDSDSQIVVAALSVGRPAMLLNRGRSVLAFQPFNDGALWRVAPGSDWFVIVERNDRSVRDGSFRVLRALAAGRAVYDRRYSYRPVAVPGPVADSVFQSALRQLAEVGYRHPRVEAEVRAALYLPAYYPPVSGLVAGRDGTVWLRRENTNASSVRWEVLDERGDFLAWLSAPAQLRVEQADRQFVWAVATDSTGSQLIERYHVRRSSR